MLNFREIESGKEKIAVVGLGYVGMPLMWYLSKKFNTLGFDIDKNRISELKSGYDRTGEINEKGVSVLDLTHEEERLKEARFIVITVPTPVDKHNMPDLKAVKTATETVGKYLREGSIVVYESTVYPGVTEDICVPILEKTSSLKLNNGFSVGYSPERINPGDKIHTIDKITKVVSASNSEALEIISSVYGSITSGGVFRAKDIKTAEAAKVIENTQRDLNIALMNELAIIFNRMGIDTRSVLEAASTKWNFLRFEPGLVGGHCIGVDPYYLTFKAQEIGYHPEVILAGRRINDSMGVYIANQAIKRMIARKKVIFNSSALILGMTFKENIPDIRNTKVVDIVYELREFGVNVDIYDPYASPKEVKQEYNIEITTKPDETYDCVVVAVKHQVFTENKDWILSLVKENGILIDVKGIFSTEEIDKHIDYWRL